MKSFSCDLSLSTSHHTDGSQVTSKCCFCFVSSCERFYHSLIHVASICEILRNVLTSLGLHIRPEKKWGKVFFINFCGRTENKDV